ncbi:gas vesicle protein [Streptomyces piniterrae]|uniref:Gas vesicle protein n=2 Tax=Streptomyces piniterrae TaxID=2571125 RepID=A0A4U0NXB7_9ACTN|nr:gas vesicle protein [Streptomyces piniterrae]
MATEEDEERRATDSGRTERITAPAAMRHASGQLAEMLRCEPGTVSALKPTHDGWSANVEVVEIEKVPDTTSVMASYRVDLDPKGRLREYERVRRYARGHLDT